MMFDRIERNRDAATQAQFARPHAAGKDHVFGFDCALIGLHARDAAVLLLRSSSTRTFFEDRGAAVRERLWPARRELPWELLCHRAAARPRPSTSSIRSSGHFSRAASGLIRCASTPKSSAMAMVRRSWIMRSSDLATIRLPTCFQPTEWPVSFFQLRVQLDGIFVDAGHAVARAQTADQTGGVPGSAGGELVLFEQDDVLPAEFRQVISDACPDDAAADNDDFASRGERIARRHSKFRKRGRLRGARLSQFQLLSVNRSGLRLRRIRKVSSRRSIRPAAVRCRPNR